MTFFPKQHFGKNPIADTYNTFGSTVPEPSNTWEKTYSGYYDTHTLASYNFDYDNNTYIVIEYGNDDIDFKINKIDANGREAWSRAYTDWQYNASVEKTYVSPDGKFYIAGTGETDDEGVESAVFFNILDSTSDGIIQQTLLGDYEYNLTFFDFKVSAEYFAIAYEMENEYGHMGFAYKIYNLESRNLVSSGEYPGGSEFDSTNKEIHDMLFLEDQSFVFIYSTSNDVDGVSISMVQVPKGMDIENKCEVLAPIMESFDPTNIELINTKMGEIILTYAYKTSITTHYSIAVVENPLQGCHSIDAIYHYTGYDVDISELMTNELGMSLVCFETRESLFAYQNVHYIWYNSHSRSFSHEVITSSDNLHITYKNAYISPLGTYVVLYGKENMTEQISYLGIEYNSSQNVLNTQDSWSYTSSKFPDTYFMGVDSVRISENGDLFISAGIQNISYIYSFDKTGEIKYSCSEGSNSEPFSGHAQFFTNGYALMVGYSGDQSPGLEESFDWNGKFYLYDENGDELANHEWNDGHNETYLPTYPFDNGFVVVGTSKENIYSSKETLSVRRFEYAYELKSAIGVYNKHNRKPVRPINMNVVSGNDPIDYFADLISSGTGSSNDPYIFSDLLFNASLYPNIIDNVVYLQYQNNDYYQFNNCIFTGITSTDDNAAAIYMDDAQRMQFFNNFFIDNAGDGLIARKVFDLEIKDNIIKNNRHGIQFRGVDYAEIEDNVIQNNEIHGIFIDILDDEASDYSILKDNTITNNGGFGIYLAGGSYNQIYNNNLCSNELGGLALPLFDENEYYDNQCGELNFSSYWATSIGEILGIAGAAVGVILILMLLIVRKKRKRRISSDDTTGSPTFESSSNVDFQL